MPYTNLLKGDANSHATSCLSQKRKAGRKKFKETRHPVFHGVRERDRGKWVCEVREPNKKSRIWLGTYPSAELAAMAHDVAALALKGERAALNFPDFAWGLAPQAKSTSAQDIRLAILQITRSELLSSKILLSGSENNNNKNDEGDKENCANNDNMKCLEKGDIVEDDSKELFLDEEAIFNMPSLINGMAEGMLLTPPSLKRGVNWDEFHDYENSSYIDLDLW